MTVIISKDGRDAKVIERSTIEKEAYLQEYIHDNPDVIPIYEIKKDTNLLVVAREFPTFSGPMDAIAVDGDGDIYIVETKLYKNKDKRWVVAQALDYGASLWKRSRDLDSLIEIFDKEISGKFDISFQEKVMSFFDMKSEDDYSIFIDNLGRNLNNGVLRFVIMMDSMDERLKDLIIYINQNSQFDIYAVELDHYKYKEYEIMIPRIFGVEVKKNIKTSTGSSIRKKWDTERFKSQAREILGRDADAIIDLYNHFESIAPITWGTGSRRGSFAPLIPELHKTISPISIYSDGQVLIKISWYESHLEQEKYDQLFNLMLSHIKDGCKERITMKKMKTESFYVAEEDVKNGYDGVKEMFNKIKNLWTESEIVVIR